MFFFWAVVGCRVRPDMQGAFETIYEGGTWANALQPPQYYYTYADPKRLARKSSSGPGSDIGPATQASLQFIANKVRDLNVSTLLDVGCGDVNWQFESWEVDTVPRYVCLDVAANVIAHNRVRFAHHNNKMFVTWDVGECGVPSHVNPDLVYMREVLQHVPLEEGGRVLHAVRQSGARYLIATTYNVDDNHNVKAGKFYRINLHKAPFNLTPTACIIVLQVRHECLYKLR